MKNREKFYMLLELEKIKENFHKLNRIYAFPTKLLYFDILLIKYSTYITCKLSKKNIEDEWVLTINDRIENNFFNSAGELLFRNREAYRVLEHINKIFNFEKDFKIIEQNTKDNVFLNKDSRNYKKKEVNEILPTMSCFINRIFRQNGENAFWDESSEDVIYVNLENKFKERNTKLLDNLCTTDMFNQE